MNWMRDRTYFDAESGSIMDLPPEMWTKRGEPVTVKSGMAYPKDWREYVAKFGPDYEHADRLHERKIDRPGEYAAYRERVEAQFSAPIPQNGDMNRAVSVVISGFDGVGKSTIGRIIARALADHGISVSLSGQRAIDGITGDEVKWPREPMSVELWEVDRASPHNH